MRRLKISMDLLFERVRVCRYNINIKNSSVSLCIPAQSVTMCNVHPQSFLQPLLPCSASTSLTHYPIVPELSQTFSWLHFDPATQEILRCSYPWLVFQILPFPSKLQSDVYLLAEVLQATLVLGHHYLLQNSKGSTA